MVTTPQNTLYTVVEDTLIHKVDVTTTYHEGDLAYLDVGTGNAKALDSDANAAFLLGVFRDTNPVAHHIMVNAQYFKDYASIFLKRGQLYRFKIVGAEAIANYTAVYYGGDAQTLTTVAGGMTHPVGMIMLRHEEGQVAHTTVAGEEIIVMLKQSYVFAQLPS